MDVITIAEKIEKKIELLETGRKLIYLRAIDKAKTIAAYDKQIAFTLIKLRNGQILTLDDEQIVDPPVSIMEKVSKGICWQEKLEAEKADALYKSAVTGLETLRVEISALQSIYRHLEEPVNNT